MRFPQKFEKKNAFLEADLNGTDTVWTVKMPFSQNFKSGFD